MTKLLLASATLTVLLSLSAQAANIETIYAEKDVRNQGIMPVKVNVAICDNTNRPKDCDLFVLGQRGRVLRFRVNSIKRTYSYNSASQREIETKNVDGKDLDLLLRLGAAIEKLGLDCESQILVDMRKGTILKVNPGCDI